MHRERVALAVGLMWLLALPGQAAERIAEPARVPQFDDLVLTVQVQARVDEGRLLFQQDLRWTLPAALGSVRLDGVAVPLLFPAVGNPPVVVERIVPPTTQSVEVEAAGALQVTRTADSLLLKGTVTADKPESIRVRFAMPITASTLRLGLSGRAAGQTWLELALLAGPPVRLTLALDWPGRTTRFEEGRERLVGGILSRPLGAADVATVTLSDLPTPARQPARTLAWIAGAVALTGLASLAARRKSAVLGSSV